MLTRAARRSKATAPHSARSAGPINVSKGVNVTSTKDPATNSITGRNQDPRPTGPRDSAAPIATMSRSPMTRRARSSSASAGRPSRPPPAARK